MIDVVERVRRESPIKVTYAWFDTGLEYRATKDHLEYLEGRYGVAIERMRPEKTVPACCREYGQPFLSKSVSEFMSRLQAHGFQWEDGSYDALIRRYPDCSSALRWWCAENGDESRFNISRNRHLREFVMENPPQFRISNRCCHWTKRRVAKAAVKRFGADLDMVGVRRSEGGNRSALRSCVTRGQGIDIYRPMLWWTDDVRDFYANHFKVRHSDCYERYGLRRTGCVGCPFARNHLAELDVMARYEPNLCRAALATFGEAYNYTMAYRDYVRRLDGGGQMSLTDLLEGAI